MNPKATNYHLSVDAKDSFQIEDIQSLVWEANLSCNLTQTSETVRSLTQSMPDQVSRQTNKGVNTHIRVLQVSLQNFLLQNLQTLLWTVLQLKSKIIVRDQVTAPLHTHNLNAQVTAPLYAQFECSCLNKIKIKHFHYLASQNFVLQNSPSACYLLTIIWKFPSSWRHVKKCHFAPFFFFFYILICIKYHLF